MNLVTMILACSVYGNNSVVNAMVDTGSHNNPLVISGKPFETATEALEYAKQLQTQNTPFNIGLMQIPSQWLNTQSASLSELLRPCKNMVVATIILNQAQNQCHDSKECALSVYQTGDPQAGLAFAHQILEYAETHPFTPPAPSAG